MVSADAQVAEKQLSPPKGRPQALDGQAIDQAVTTEPAEQQATRDAGNRHDGATQYG